jgi:hypothetical protein
MIQRLLSISLCAAALSLSTPAQGKSPEFIETVVDGHAFKKKCHKGDPTKSCTMFIPKGSKAPFSGVLYMPRLAAQQAVAAAGVQDRVELAVRGAKEEAAVIKKYDDRIHAIELETKDKEIALVEDALKEAVSTSWYTHPAFVVPVTVVLTVALIKVAADVTRP